MSTQTISDNAALLAKAKLLSVAHVAAQRAMRAATSRLSSALKPAKITPAQFCLLSLLYRDEPPTVKDVADEIGIDHPQVSAQYSILARKSLITGSYESSDRKRRLSLTQNGRQVLDAALPLWLDATAGEPRLDVLNAIVDQFAHAANHSAESA